MSQDTQIYRLSEGESLSQAVVHTLAHVRGVEPTNLDVRLFDAVDPDALDDLFAPADGASERSGSVAFEIAGCRIEIHGTSRVLVTPSEDARSAPEITA
ncbi:HalOD1 output domain-containing protein [Halomicrobium salinisoli]|uniref:HalOD1 output domain-containing protein n=1 Tax=Halomicrobium salinisoli TaxID=2878391 RepID=UPI001CF005DD|nr:HalOD1 output domain-containing protein [Halomicrobium salinisoli]